MKILLLNLLMSLSLGTDSNTVSKDYAWITEDRAIEEINLTITENITEMVKIIDAEGNVIREITKADFTTNNMEVSDYKMLSSSSHMFDYLGDAYYLLEE